MARLTVGGQSIELPPLNIVANRTFARKFNPAWRAMMKFDEENPDEATRDQDAYEDLALKVQEAQLEVIAARLASTANPLTVAQLADGITAADGMKLGAVMLEWLKESGYDLVGEGKLAPTGAAPAPIPTPMPLTTTSSPALSGSEPKVDPGA